MANAPSADFMQNLMDKIGESASTAGGNFIQPGSGTLIVDKMILHEGHKGLSYIATFVVKSSKDMPGSDKPANAPGTSCKQIQNLNPGPHLATFLGNVKAMLEGICGEYPSKEQRAMVVGEEQILRGMLVDYETYEKVSKSSGKDLDLVNWHTVPEEKGNTPAEIAARRKDLEAREGKSATAPAVA